MPDSYAKVPCATGMAVWGKVWPHGSKLHDKDGRIWLSFAVYVRQPGNTYATMFINWQDYTWVPEKKTLVICQGVPILRIDEGGSPFFVLRCYGSKGVRAAYNTNL